MYREEVGKFNLYAKDYGVSSLTLNSYNNYLEKNIGYNPIQGNLTPYVIEERQMNVTQIDVFSRLMLDRIIWISGAIHDRMSPIVQAQLMFLDNLDKNKDITLHVDSPGGQVSSGLSIVDTMDFIRPDVATVNTGLAASMGSVILGAGAKGKRKSLRFSKTMLHQSSGGAGGNIQDAVVTMEEWHKTNNILFGLLGEYCNKTPEQVKEDCTRDFWLTSDEAKEYGIIDSVIQKR